ncbi:unnamed protein product [Didymodactylos carnosus]|uniref:Uncharacterized protein n=1 Tax=Didymodactylos carnosus TaxID=1234261 RepID=A0A815S7X4_9BILA|nr:unnamed protein product [Didymodactylos carnosus]CAF1488379.1 unnamed protein product [Didymodactylos carnosus]CAF4043114.1 unnamed protein product [Didymodactylos carnosus]CAF4351949.1 unnamed protein product [Didymodactylos carnosus]
MLSNYPLLQEWAFHRINRYPPRDIGKALADLEMQKDLSTSCRFNIHIVCANLYQVCGIVEKTQDEIDQAKQLSLSYPSNNDRLIKDDQMKEVCMKTRFRIMYLQKHNNQLNKHKEEDFGQNKQKQKVNITIPCLKTSDAFGMRTLWRNVVLNVMDNLESASYYSRFMFNHALIHPIETLSHACSVYIGLNLAMLEENAIQELSHRVLGYNQYKNIWNCLEDIAKFNQHTEESKEISHIHRMAHIWGTAAAAYYLYSRSASPKDLYFLNCYKVCASITRVTIEYSGVVSGFEVLQILARQRIVPFFRLLNADCGLELFPIKVVKDENSVYIPECIDYFRKLLAKTVRGVNSDRSQSILFSVETVDKFVTELFNNDATA